MVDVSQAAATLIKVLERAGLVRRTVDGRRHVCRLEAAPLASASVWLRFYERHWAKRLDALEALFPADPTPTHDSRLTITLREARAASRR